METYFAPAKRSGKMQLASQIRNIGSCHVMDTLLRASAGLLLVINANRQVIAFNKACADSLGIADTEKALGLRFGEILHCKHAFEEPHGCGTTPYCSSCGAVITMMAAIDDNRACERICALTTERNGQSHDICLLVRSQPVVTDGKRWILVYAQDISLQQHWANLENEFLHDLDNMLCQVKNFGDYLHDQAPAHEVLNKLRLTTDRVFREVKLQNKLKHHRQIKSLAKIERVNLRSIRNMVFNIVLYRSVMTGKNVVEEGPADDLYISTDPVLVSRVIINMLLNALEATELGETIKLRTLVEETRITWQVWNKAFIPENIQLRIFQKFFSTKPEIGKGHGTHVMKLLAEKYLGGDVGFVSTIAEGTTFSFTLQTG
ncbi:MAG TPA: sensor histidine kinase [Geobacteraceae bacterium]|nr:sensor histidine kinase [Geobacteraceae bacterium]